MANNPSETKFFGALTSQVKVIIDAERKKGNIYESKTRWDLKDQQDFDKIPIETLLDDSYYGGSLYDPSKDEGGLWSEHRQDIIDLWKARKEHGTDTFVDIEGIGSGKTHKFRHILRLMVLEVITREEPLSYYGLDPKGQGISFVCMSRNATLAKEVTFTTILKAFDCPFFDEYFPPLVDFKKMEDSPRQRPSMLRFPKGIVIFPGTGSALSALGYNLFGGGIDEANYLEVVDESKKAFVGKSYDAAELMYNAIKARMTSRFLRKGRIPGLLMMFSNTRYRNDFLERMGTRSKKDRKIFFRRRCTWEGHPKERYSGKTFSFDAHNMRIIS